MQELTIQDWDDLLIAREERNPLYENEYYLDRETGAVAFFSFETVDLARDEDEEPPSIEWVRTDLENYRQIFEEPGRYVRVEAAEASDAWERMASFVRTLDDSSVAARLTRAIEGKGAFRRFGDEVHALGVEKDWFAYQHHRQVAEAIDWLATMDIVPTNPPATQVGVTRSESERRLESALGSAVTELEELLLSFRTSRIDEIEAVLLARRLGEKLVEL